MPLRESFTGVFCESEWADSCRHRSETHVTEWRLVWRQFLIESIFRCHHLLPPLENMLDKVEYVLTASVLFIQAKEQHLISWPQPEARGPVGQHLAVVLACGCLFPLVAPLPSHSFLWVTSDYQGLTMQTLDLSTEQHMNQ